MSVTIYPTPVQPVTVSGTAETTDRAVEQVLDAVHLQLRKLNDYNVIITDEKIKNEDVTT